MNRKVDVVVTFLEIKGLSQPALSHPPASVGKLALMQVENMPVHFYRYLFEKVGREYKWVSRHFMGDRELTTIIHHDEIELFVLYVDGSPAGYYEIDFRKSGEAEVSFIGLMKDFVGKGLGKYLITSAMHRVWEREVPRIHLQTCTLDHPRALQFYQKSGFVPFAQKDVVLDIPDEWFED